MKGKNNKQYRQLIDAGEIELVIPLMLGDGYNVHQVCEKILCMTGIRNKIYMMETKGARNNFDINIIKPYLFRITNFTNNTKCLVLMDHRYEHFIINERNFYHFKRKACARIRYDLKVYIDNNYKDIIEEQWKKKKSMKLLNQIILTT